MTPEINVKLVSSESRPLTADLVQQHLTLPASPTDRPLSEQRVEFLHHRLEAGLFHPPHWVQARVGGKLMRANGYHSATMLSRLNGAFPADLSVHLDVFECGSMDDLAALFRQFDDRRSARTPADVSGAYQGLRKELNDVPRSVGKLGVEGIAWHQRVVQQDKEVPQGDDRYTLFNRPTVQPFLQWLGDIYGSGIPKPLAKLPVVGAMFATFMADKDAADSFWKEVAADGREYEEEWPTTVLANWLQQIRSNDISVKPRNHYQGCIYAWNALRDGKTALGNIRCDVKKAFYRPL